MMISYRRKFSTPGTLTIITGNRGSGKTDLSLRFAETIVEKHPKIKILTNIFMKGPAEDWNITVITKLTELLENMVQHDRIHLILDEAGIFATSGSAGNRGDVGQWEQFIKLFRKFGISMMWLDQRGVGSVPPTMRTLCNFHVHKKDLFSYLLWNGFKEMEGTKRIDGYLLSKKDRTVIPFDTNATASFIMDLPKIDGYQYTIRDLFDRLSNVNSEQVRATMKEWLQEVKSKEEQEHLNIERELKEALQGGPSGSMSLQDCLFWIFHDAEKRKEDLPKTGDLSKILGRTKQQISNIKSKYRKEKSSINVDNNISVSPSLPSE
jgi:hypothetical protein